MGLHPVTMDAEVRKENESRPHDLKISWHRSPQKTGVKLQSTKIVEMWRVF